MTIPLLTTKFYIPTLRPNLVPRLPLVERLEQGLQHGHRLTLISAPAGFGKTTLVTEWLYSKAQNISSRSIAWLALDDGDNDPARFFTYLIAALQQIDEHIGQAAQSLLGAPQLPSFEALTTLIINDIESTSPFVLVLDDYHLIHTTLIHEAIAFLVEHQPPQMHLCLVTREDPPFALPRLRVRGQITEIRAHDLRFTVQEVATFLNQVLDLVLDADSVAALETRTEGWVAGLQMAALSMQSRDDPAGFIAAFSGSNRHIIDYLADEVLNQQTSEIREFFTQTSILERLNAPLCDALTERENSDKVLKQLEQANLFIVPLDDQRKWYRYHQLFADFLRTELVPEQAARLHLRAAQWFETQDLLPEAVNHILSYAMATGDTFEAVRMITQAGNRALSDGAVITLLSWLDALPDEIVRASSWLAAYKAWCLLMTGQPEMGQSYVQSAEAILTPEASPVDRGRVLSLRCAAADAEEILRLAPQALDLIGDADPLSRTGTLFMLGDAQDAVGDVTGAIETFREAYHLGQQHNHQIMAAVALAHLAISTNYRGRRREALVICQRGMEQYADACGNPLPVADLLYVVRGELAYEANDLEQARQYLQKALDLGKQSGTTLVVLYSLEALAQVLDAMRQAQEAMTVIQNAQELASQAGELEWRGAGTAIEITLRLRQGDYQTAKRWIESTDLPLNAPLDQTRKFEYTAHVRTLLALGKAREAQTLLAELENAARTDGRYRHLLTIHIQQALAAQKLGDLSQALKLLGKALRLAAPEDYVHAFLDEDPILAQLMLHVRDIAPAFVDKLLASFDLSQPSSQHQMLIEPLSDRERQVLRLLAADLPVPEIADEMVVAVSTVRSHIKHIYQKLDTHSRHETIERARVLGLL